MYIFLWRSKQQHQTQEAPPTEPINTVNEKAACAPSLEPSPCERRGEGRDSGGETKLPAARKHHTSKAFVRFAINRTMSSLSFSLFISQKKKQSKTKTSALYWLPFVQFILFYLLLSLG
jgi:hypothetical protein